MDKTIELVEQLNKNPSAVINFLKDTLKDMEQRIKTKNIIICVLTITLIISILEKIIS